MLSSCLSKPCTYVQITGKVKLAVYGREMVLQKIGGMAIEGKPLEQKLSTSQYLGLNTAPKNPSQIKIMRQIKLCSLILLIIFFTKVKITPLN